MEAHLVKLLKVSIKMTLLKDKILNQKINMLLQLH